MKSILLIIYDLFLFLYKTIAIFLSLSNSKAKKWVYGRVADKEKLKLCKTEKKIWFHASSLGEFEQGRPLIEKLKKELPQYPIVLTFFSPSGYEIRKNYPYADYIYYLPLDGKKRSRNFIDQINPLIAVFIKYDLWFYYFKYLKEKSIPLIIVSADFRAEQFDQNLYSKLFNLMLTKVEYIFTQNKKSEELLKSKGFSNVSTAGDTRIDRVLTISDEIDVFSDKKIEAFCKESSVLIAGSSYYYEANLIKKCIESNQYHFKYLLVPHIVNVRHLNEIIRIFKGNIVFWSKCHENDDFSNKQLMVVDTIGILNKIYKYGDIALIGGGFNNSIHNLLEPAASKLPVIFGPKNHHKFSEAKAFIDLKSGFIIENEDDFFKAIDYLLENNNYRYCGEKAYNYLLENSGATQKIYEYISKRLLSETH